MEESLEEAQARKAAEKPLEEKDAAELVQVGAGACWWVLVGAGMRAWEGVGGEGNKAGRLPGAWGEWLSGMHGRWRQQSAAAGRAELQQVFQCHAPLLAALVLQEFPTSQLLPALGRRYAAASLLAPPLHGPLLELLKLEKKCIKWWAVCFGLV